MFYQLSFSNQSFSRLISYRVADQFRPLAAPVNFPKKQDSDLEQPKSWLDGVLVTDVALNRSPSERVVILNERKPANAVGPNDSRIAFSADAVTLDLTLNLYFVRVEDVASAGLKQPAPVTIKSIFKGIIHVTMRADLGADGIPRLTMELDKSRLALIDLDPTAVAAITASASASIPFDIVSQIRDVLPAGSERVLNAGVTLDDNGTVIIRFEFSEETARPLTARLAEWDEFFSGSLKTDLGNQDWSLDLDGRAVAAVMAAKIAPDLTDKKPVHFDPTSIDSGFIDGSPPRVFVKEHGFVENACAGNDINFDLFINLDFSIPQDNLLRGMLGIDYVKDTGDVARCFALEILNPLSIFITAVDQNKAGAGLVALAASRVLPVQQLVFILGLTALLAGVDEIVVQGIIADKLHDKPLITALPDGSFAIEKPLKVKTELTHDWLVLKEALGVNGRLLLRGAFGVPDVVLPRLSAADRLGFSKWSLVDRCDPGKGQVTTASLSLTLVPGYADPAALSPAKPTIPLKFALNPDGTTLAYAVINDPLGIYQDAGSDYQQVSLLIPGGIEARLTSTTVLKPNFNDARFDLKTGRIIEPFASAPYPLRLRLFTNAGVREYEFAAPAAFKPYEESVGQKAERINRCMQLGSDLLFRKYLEVLWLVNPPWRDVGVPSQQWDLHFLGVEPGRKATVWDRETGAALVRAFADSTRRIDVSIVLRGDQQAKSLLVSLDDLPFLATSLNRLHDESAPPDEKSAVVQVALRQTHLYQVDQFDFPSPVEALQFVGAGRDRALLIRTVENRLAARATPSPYVANAKTPARVRGDIVEDARKRGQIAWWGDERRFTLFSNNETHPHVVADYAVRSSYELSASRDELFAQISSDGRSVMLYQRGAALQLGASQWRD